MENTIKAILADPGTGMLTLVDLPRGAAMTQATATLLEAARIVDVPLRNAGAQRAIIAWIDDEGLYKPSAGCWSESRGPQPAPIRLGKAVFTGLGDEGWAADVPVTVEQLADLIVTKAPRIAIDPTRSKQGETPAFTVTMQVTGRPKRA